MEAGRIAAGSSRVSRLDPFSLPVRFETADEAADEQRRVIDLHREHVVVRRSVRGMRMALNLPVTAFRGVAIRLNRAANSTRRPRSTSCSSMAIRRCLCRCSRPAPATTSWPSGSRGAACSVCRFSSPSATAACASRSPASAPYASKRRPGGAGDAAPLRAAAPKSCCGAGRARRSDTPRVHRGEREIIARN